MRKKTSFHKPDKFVKSKKKKKKSEWRFNISFCLALLTMQKYCLLAILRVAAGNTCSSLGGMSTSRSICRRTWKIDVRNGAAHLKAMLFPEAGKKKKNGAQKRWRKSEDVQHRRGKRASEEKGRQLW